jgi:hypothetical protein
VVVVAIHVRVVSSVKKKYRRGGVELMGYETRRDASRCLLLPPCRRTVAVADTVRSPGHPTSVGRSLIKCFEARPLGFLYDSDGDGDGDGDDVGAGAVEA